MSRMDLGPGLCLLLTLSLTLSVSLTQGLSKMVSCVEFAAPPAMTSCTDFGISNGRTGFSPDFIVCAGEVIQRAFNNGHLDLSQLRASLVIQQPIFNCIVFSIFVLMYPLIE